MADTCFEDYSSLGAGVNNYDNELTEAPEEEEEFDVLNDETFGDLGNDDFNWEEQTERFAEELDPKYHHGGRKKHNDDSGFSTAEKTYKTQEEYMERNISQLMIDDEDVDNDPASVNTKKSRPIPKKQQSLDMLFGPSSPPSLLDAEYLVSPTSKNIWGSPISETFHHPQHTHLDNIQSLFDFAKSATAEPSLHGIHHHHKASPIVLPKAQTLEEIESSFHQKPRVLTAEQLERQLLGESPDSVQRRTSALQAPGLPNGNLAMPPMNVPPPGMSPQIRPMGPSMGMSPSGLPGSGGVANGHRSPTPGSIAPPTVLSTPIGRGNMRGVHAPYSSSPMAGSPGPQMRTTPPPFRNMSTPHNRQSPATPGRGLSQPIGIPRGGIRGPVPPGSPFSSPQQGVYGSPQGSYPSPQQYRMHHPGSYGDGGYNRNMNSNKYQSPQSTRGNFHNKDRPARQEQPYNREHRYHRYPYNQHHEERPAHRPGYRGDEDEYAGLMLQKEKEWIIKIQLLQLQTDNPYLHDYYYHAFTLKKKAKERAKEGKEDDKESGPKLLIPSFAHIENRAYKPAQFEGSLGRLTTSSVHNPRQIIDLLAKSVSEAAGSNKMTSNVGKELRKSRQLLMDIEKGYNLLLDIDDLEKQILALPEEMRKPLLELRSDKIDLLFHYLLCDGVSPAFMQYMNVRKGRSLTTRALPLLDKVQSVGIVSMICKNIQQLMKKDQTSEKDLVGLYEPCSKVMETCNLATIVMFVEDIQQEESQSTAKPIAIALQNKFGCSILCSLLHRGEEIYSSSSPIDMDSNLQDEWSEFVHEFASIVATIPMESVSAPVNPFENIKAHLERILNKRLMAVVEDNLRIFTHSQESVAAES